MAITERDNSMYLAQDPNTFDQTEVGWRSIQGRQEKLEAIKRYLETYAPNDVWLPTTPISKEELSVSLMNWHLGQLYAMINETDKAIHYMSKSIGSHDREWNDYVNATIGFLKKDRARFDKHATAENSNKNTIDKLRACFEKSYDEAYNQ